MAKKDKPEVTIIACGRFHFHKYLHIFNDKFSLRKFVYSYRINYNFNVPKNKRENHPAKEYLMYMGRYVLSGKLFYKYLILLHNLWQFQVTRKSASGDILHFLVHGNCKKIIEKYKKKGIKVIGEVVNAHPETQEKILTTEYKKYNLIYSSGEVTFKNKIITELKMCDYLLVPSSFIKKTLIEHGIADETIMVLPYGLKETTDIKEKAIISTDRPIKLVCIAQLNFRKGIIYLLEAVQQLNAQGINCELTIVGKADQEYLPFITQYLELDFVHHITHVDNSEVYSLMKTHDLFVMPSLEDGFGIVVSEALSVHLPVIVTNNCGASEIVVDGENGFIIEASSEKAIRDAIIKSIGYNFLFNKPLLTWQDYATKLNDIYIKAFTN